MDQIRVNLLQPINRLHQELQPKHLLSLTPKQMYRLLKTEESQQNLDEDHQVAKWLIN